MKTVDIENRIYRGNYIYDKDVRQPGGNTTYPVLDYVHDKLWEPMEFHTIVTEVATSFYKLI